MDEHANVLRPELPIEYWKMYLDDSTPQICLDPSGLDLAANLGSGWQGSRANKGVKGPGKYYYEGKVVEDGLIRFGWSTNDASLDLGSDRTGFGYGHDEAATEADTGFKRNNKEEKPYGKPIHVDDVIGAIIYFDNGQIQWSINGDPLGIAYDLSKELQNETFFPASCVKDGKVQFNFGDLPMINKPPIGCKTLAQAPVKNVVPNKHVGWRMNPFDAIKGTEVSENGLMIQSKYNDEWHGCRANKGLFDAGKYYYEVVPLEDGLSRVGWATDDGSLHLGSDCNGFGYGADQDGFGINGNQGKKMNGGEIENYGDSYGKGDVIGCFLDLDNHKIKWSKNGQVYKEAYLIPDDLMELRAFYPTASLLNNTLDFNFGNKPFGFYPGREWKAVCYADNDNTEHSKKHDPLLVKRPSTDRCEGVLELRRLHKEKLRNERENSRKIKELEEERILMNIKEKERIEMQEMEKRLMLQKQRDEQERERLDAERRLKAEHDREDARMRLIHEDEQKRTSLQAKETTDIEEESQTVIKGEPEIRTETYIDDEGRTVTRIVKKTKITTRTSINRNSIERTEDEFSHNRLTRMKGLDIIDEDNDDLNKAIFDVTRFNRTSSVLDVDEDATM